MHLFKAARLPLNTPDVQSVPDGAPERGLRATMVIEETTIPGVMRLQPKKFGDARGHFVEVFNRKVCEAAGLAFQPVQENQSLSRITGTVRGLHFQRAPHVQAKLVRVLRGSIFDVAVDIRLGSPTYGQWVGAELTSSGGEQLFIPGGFAHGFCTLEPDTEIAYLVDGYYSAECDGGILWNDPDLRIAWPTFAGAVLSAKDEAAPRLSDIPPPF
jgi:dTDP-4-dehydrorhamnose 3,5-epimerase